tara:strand:- start:340 stop:450 length:111 start_codon:yes stop_codon:yes gene_type:complete
MHKTDKEALQAIGLLFGAVALFVTVLWSYAIMTGQV